MFTDLPNWLVGATFICLCASSTKYWQQSRRERATDNTFKEIARFAHQPPREQIAAAQEIQRKFIHHRTESK